MELDPRYCDVILSRLERVSGLRDGDFGVEDEPLIRCPIDRGFEAEAPGGGARFVRAFVADIDQFAVAIEPPGGERRGHFRNELRAHADLRAMVRTSGSTGATGSPVEGSRVVFTPRASLL